MVGTKGVQMSNLTKKASKSPPGPGWCEPVVAIPVEDIVLPMIKRFPALSKFPVRIPSRFVPP